jgi:Universal stress protein family
VIEHVLVGLALVLGLGGGYLLARSRLRRSAGGTPQDIRRILFPFSGLEVSRRGLDAALRLARAEHSTLMPAYLAVVPKRLPLDCALPAEAEKAMAILEAIEQRGAAQGVAVDARVERGRSYRHALERLLAEESVDRVVVPIAAPSGAGFSGEDLAWLLDRTPAEVLILRPAPSDASHLSVSGLR